jgi:superfamily I DNA/RNA helicase
MSLPENLTEEQKAAVTADPSVPLLVLAGAGCGKTTVLIRRIAWCAETFCPADRILALTFTRKAAQEMDERLKGIDLLTSTGKMPLVTTFHGFAHRVIHEKMKGQANWQRLGYTVKPELLTKEQRLALLAGVSTADQRQALGADIEKLDSLLERITVNPGRRSALSASHLEILDLIDKRLSEAKKDRRAWEFSDMIQSTLKLFDSFPEIADEYARRFSLILVDEFQDTNPLQINMLNRLLIHHKRLFAVGDDDQAIYGFRGADTGPILRFEEQFPGARICALQVNFRSTPAILGSANRIFSDKPAKYRKVLRAGLDMHQGPSPRKVRCHSPRHLAEWICKSAAKIQSREKIPIHRMAVLFRLNATLDQLRGIYCGIAGGEDAVMPQFHTVHGAKGLEFPVVFLCDLEESIFPYYREKHSHRIHSWTDLLRALLRKKRSGDVDFDEERRLFYVGVTRAARRLFCISMKEKEIFGKRVRLKRSRFLKLF